MDLWSQISTLAVGKVEKKNLFQKLVPIFQTFWQPFGRMCISAWIFAVLTYDEKIGISWKISV